MNSILMLYCRIGYVAQSSVWDLFSEVAFLLPEDNRIEAVKTFKVKASVR